MGFDAGEGKQRMSSGTFLGGDWLTLPSCQLSGDLYLAFPVCPDFA